MLFAQLPGSEDQVRRTLGPIPQDNDFPKILSHNYQPYLCPIFFPGAETPKIVPIYQPPERKSTSFVDNTEPNGDMGSRHLSRQIFRNCYHSILANYLINTVPDSLTTLIYHQPSLLFHLVHTHRFFLHYLNEAQQLAHPLHLSRLLLTSMTHP